MSFFSKHDLQSKVPDSSSHCHFGFWPSLIIALLQIAHLSGVSSCLIMNSFVFSKWQLPQSRPVMSHSWPGLYLWRPSSLPHTAQFSTCFFPKMCKRNYLPVRVQKCMSAFILARSTSLARKVFNPNRAQGAAFTVSSTTADYLLMTVLQFLLNSDFSIFLCSIRNLASCYQIFYIFWAMQNALIKALPS